jgi:hypothetical protein
MTLWPRQDRSNTAHDGRDAQHDLLIIFRWVNDLRYSSDQRDDQDRAGTIRKPQNPQIFRIRRKTRKFEKMSQTAMCSVFRHHFECARRRELVNLDRTELEKHRQQWRQ